MAIIDVFTFNGEYDILRLRLAILSPFVDKFIIVEAKTTFSGKPKPLYFSPHEGWYEKYWPKIEYFIINEGYTQEEFLAAKNSPNTQGAAHWTHEFLQKESIKKALVGLKDDDICYIGDVDEIWDPNQNLLIERTVKKAPTKLKLKVYAYYLNNRSNEEFWGTLVARYKDIKDECLNHLRSNVNFRSEKTFGWHFTSMGGVDEVRRKLNDSYTKDSYNTPEVQSLLPERLSRGIDYLGRPFEFTKDETDWPKYLKKNKSHYKHLCLPLDSKN